MPSIPSPFIDLGHELVVVHVGKELKTFTIHKTLICAKSDYFKKAFTSGFIESKGILYLPEDSPDVFVLFVEWLYRDTVRDCISPWEFFSLHNFYIFAEKICEQHLANLIIDAIRGTLHSYTPTFVPALTGYIYARTAEKSPLRKLSLQHFVWSSWALDDDTSSRNHIPGRKSLERFYSILARDEDLFVDFFGAINRSQRKGTRDSVEDPSRVAGCAYHTHTTDEHCYLEKDEIVPIIRFKVMIEDGVPEAIEKYMDEE
ncbi:hypothetical protein PZA11_000724 [Diplocarpon coronariae]|uniref:BTB domain-containing protein n=1 Tax=Diplocarpon coronariae TaxID=2795749 RepID=A0A218YWL2_9HELO|nr:hypothetical protein JHW43_008354 [Diplocarpon mali]OWO99626.1 hypothetical protein B2J93_4952 [Marssonina coronariae]